MPHTKIIEPISPTIDELIEKLKQLATNPNFDPITDHQNADLLLLQFIGNVEVYKWFCQIEKFYV